MLKPLTQEVDMEAIDGNGRLGLSAGGKNSISGLLPFRCGLSGTIGEFFDARLKQLGKEKTLSAFSFLIRPWLKRYRN